MLNRLRTVVAAAMLTVATYAAAQAVGEHPDTYVVRKGDTLWDIAGRFLQKPWLWPEIWQANPQIQNPHLIYPGDVISLAYLDRVGKGTVQPGPRQEAPINAIPLADVEPFLKNLRVVDDFDQLPYVVGLEGGRTRATTGQVAYVVGLDNAQPGQRFAVVRPTVKFSLPKHNEDLDMAGNITAGSGNIWKNFIAPSTRREFLGYEMAQVNVGTITRSAAGGNSRRRPCCCRTAAAKCAPAIASLRSKRSRTICSSSRIRRRNRRCRPSCACWPSPTPSPLAARAM